jgi:hypothetical protein
VRRPRSPAEEIQSPFESSRSWLAASLSASASPSLSSWCSQDFALAATSRLFASQSRSSACLSRWSASARMLRESSRRSALLASRASIWASRASNACSRSSVWRSRWSTVSSTSPSLVPAPVGLFLIGFEPVARTLGSRRGEDVTRGVAPSALQDGDHVRCSSWSLLWRDDARGAAKAAAKRLRGPFGLFQAMAGAPIRLYGAAEGSARTRR